MFKVGMRFRALPFIQHPTSGGRTYNLRQKGIDMLKEVKEQND